MKLKMSPTMSALIHCRAFSTSAARNMPAATYYFIRSNNMQMDHLRTTINTHLCSPNVGFEEESKERGFLWRMKDQKAVIQLPAGLTQKMVQVLTIKGEIVSVMDLQ